MQITLEEPEFYLERLNRGLILDPSVFYTIDHLKSLSQVILAIRSRSVFLPSLLYEAITQRQSTRFRNTMNHWSARYEELPEVWQETQSIVDQLGIKPIPEPESGPVVSWLSNRLEIDRRTRRGLQGMVFEMTAMSIQQSFPILACESSSFRILEFLKKRFDAVVLEPGRRWGNKKRERLSDHWFLLKALYAAFLFVAVDGEPTTAVRALVTTVIDG